MPVIFYIMRAYERENDKLLINPIHVNCWENMPLLFVLLQAKYTSPQSQMVIVFVLVIIEVGINVCWLLYSPPREVHHCDARVPHRYDTRHIGILPATHV